MIVGTWGFWLLGSLYHVFPILAWTLAIWGFSRRMGFTETDPATMKPLPVGVWVWFAGMVLMLIALVVGHLNFDHSLLTMAKSLMGWVKGWALFAILPFAGASLRIRPQIVFRAMNMLAAQTLIIMPFFILGSVSGLPTVLYVSPLMYLGGASVSFFSVGTHWIDPGSPDIRLRFFSPWAPAAALVAQVSMVLSLYDRDVRWRVVGVVSSVLVCILAKSRLSTIAIPVILLAIPILSRIHRPVMIGAAGIATVTGAFAFSFLQVLIEQGIDTFKSARADSSRVRETLQRIAIHRWSTEAPIFGHGLVERGSHLVEFMPIGSHHTWNGLLFVKGGAGFVGLAFPMAFTFVDVLLKAQRDRVARAALGVMIVLFINSFGENLEILGYLIWPGLLMLGIAMNRRRVGIWTQTLGCPR